ncbi:flagellar protein FlhE, partial [Escherichia coli]
MFKFLVLTLGIISCQAYAEDTVIVNDHDISAIKDCWQKNSDDDTDINVIKSCLRQEYNLVDAQLNKAYGEAYRYVELEGQSGTTVAFSGIAAAEPLRFIWEVPGGGRLIPPLKVQRNEVIVN